MDLAFKFKVASLVFIHPEHQFFAPDTDYKVPVTQGENVFVTVSHDVTHSLPRETEGDGASISTCEDIFDYDKCILDVIDSILIFLDEKYLQ